MTAAKHAFEQPALDVPFQSIRAVLTAYRERHPDRIALYDLDQEKSITWEKLDEWANRVARYLESRGIRKGDRIGLLADESIDKMIVWMGIWRLGAVVCPLNVEINADHIRDLLRSIGPKLTLWHVGLDGEALAGDAGGELMKFDSWTDGMAGDPASDEFLMILPRPCRSAESSTTRSWDRSPAWKFKTRC